jgi:hypothetical protein
VIVYKLSSPSGKIYVGQTIQEQIDIRFRQHVQSWKRWIKIGRPRRFNCTKLYYAFDTYPPEDWSHEILFISNDRDEINDAEIRLISEYDSVENGYNIMLGGQAGWRGLKLDDDHKKAIGTSRDAYWLTEEGQAWKKELSERLTKNNPGAEYRRGKASWNRGKKMRKEHKEKMDAGAKEWWNSPQGMAEKERKADWAREQAKKNTGRKYTPEQLERRSKQSPTNLKTWEVIHPDGKVEIVTNIAQFFREQNMDSKSASAKISSSGKYKGYTAKKIEK